MNPFPPFDGELWASGSTKGAGVVIKKCIEAYRAHCHAEGCFIDPDTRAHDCMWWRLLEAFEKPCEWTPEEVRKAFRVYEDDEA